jgi:hypothetical protein
MTQKRVYVVGAVLMAAAFGVPATGVFSPGGPPAPVGGSDAPPPSTVVETVLEPSPVLEATVPTASAPPAGLSREGESDQPVRGAPRAPGEEVPPGTPLHAPGPRPAASDPAIAPSPPVRPSPTPAEEATGEPVHPQPPPLMTDDPDPADTGPVGPPPPIEDDTDPADQ